MTEALALKPGEKVLEIGTGSGFQAAMLAEMGARVFTIEIIDALAERATATLRAEGYEDVHVRAGDGYQGWPEEAPFDAIILTAAPEQVPQALLDQLRPNSGRLLVPEGPQGPGGQTLRLYRKARDGTITAEPLLAVRFVPMVREQN
jgi:protein-L-isoaspartate(D-aspartate) O-methyltransferase